MRSFSSSVRSHHAIPSNHPCHAMPCHAMYLFSYSPFPFRSIPIPISVSVRPSPTPLMPFPMLPPPPFFGWKTALIDLIPSLARYALNQRAGRPGPLCSTAVDDIHTYIHTYIRTYVHGRTHHVCDSIPPNLCERWFMVIRTRHPKPAPLQRRVLQARRVGGREGR